MPNITERIEKYMTQAVDTVFAMESKSAILRNGSKFIDTSFKEAGYVKIASIAMDGLSDYHRVNNGIPGTDDYVNYPTKDGYQLGDTELTWELFPLRFDRGKQFRIDSMDNEETAGLMMGNLVTEFLRTKVVPEQDAVTFSTIASNASETLGNLKAGEIAENTILKDFNTAYEWLTEHEVPEEDQVIFVSPKVMTLIQNSTELVRYLSQAEYKNGDITFKIQTYQGREIVVVPSNRFFTDVVCGSNGYHGSAKSKIINYIICSKKAVMPIVKLEKSRVFAPEVVQDYDGYKINFRMYHDTVVPRNKIPGVYVSVSNVVATTKTNILSVNVVKEGTNYVVKQFFTNPAGIISSQMIYSKTTLTVGQQANIDNTNIKKIALGYAFSKLNSETEGYFGLVDSNNNILAVSARVTLPLN